MLKLTNLHKTFNAGTVNEKKALNGLNFQLDRGDFATIVGSNGAGKSTFFNAVAGDLFVDEGSIRLDGADITYLPAYRRSRQIGKPSIGAASYVDHVDPLARRFCGRADIVYRVGP